MRILSKFHSLRPFVQEKINYVSDKKTQLFLAIIFYFVTQNEVLESFVLIRNFHFPRLPSFHDYICLLRPYGWISNFVSIGLGILLTNSWILQSETILPKYIITGIAIGPLLWGGLYTFNSIFDAEFDRSHPTKMNRPIANHRISENVAVLIALVHITFGLLLIGLISPIGLFLSLLMVICQIFYCFQPFHFKERIIDLFFSGPLNHIFRILIGWTLVLPLLKAPYFFLGGVFCILNVGYLSYKLQDIDIAHKFKYNGLENYLSRSKNGVLIFDSVLIILSIILILSAFFSKQIVWQMLLLIPVSVIIFLYIALSSSGLFKIAKPGKFISKIHNLIIIFLIFEFIVFILPILFI